MKTTLVILLTSVLSMGVINAADDATHNAAPKTKLLQAIKDGNFDSVEDIIIDHDDLLNSVDHDKKRNTMLHLAASAGHDKIVDFLIAEGACINAQNRHKKTPLHEAVANGRNNVAARLLKHRNTDPNIQDNDGNTPLHLAIDSQNLECVRYLLDHRNLDPSVPNKFGLTPDGLLNSLAGSVRPDLRVGAKAIKDVMEPFANTSVKDILKKKIEITPELEELAEKVRMGGKKMFLSYCWNKKHSTVPMVDDFEGFLINMGLKDYYVRDKREEQGYGMTAGTNIREFMDKAAGSDGVIIFLNEEYLKSWNCMYEFWQVWDVEKRKPLPTASIIRHPDCTNIFGQTGHAEYTAHWLETILDLEKKQGGLSLDAKGSHVAAAQEAERLRRNMEPIVGWLAGHILSDYRTLRQKGFREILQNVIEPGVERTVEASLVQEAARRFEALEKRDEENKNKIDTIKKELQELKERNQTNDKEREETNKRIEELKNSLKLNKDDEAVKEEIEKYNNYLKSLMDKSSQYEQKAEILEKNQEALQQEKTTLGTALSALKTQFSNIEEERENLRKEWQDIRAEAEGRNNQSFDAMQAEITKMKAEATQKAEDLDKRDKENRERMESINKELQEIKQQNQKNDEEKNEIKQRITALKTELEKSLKSDNEGLKREIIESQNHLQDLTEKNSQYKQKIEALEKRQEVLQQEKTTLDTALSKLKTQFATIEQEQGNIRQVRAEEEDRNKQSFKDLQGEITKLREALKELETGTVNRIASVKKELQETYEKKMAEQKEATKQTTEENRRLADNLKSHELFLNNLQGSLTALKTTIDTRLSNALTAKAEASQILEIQNQITGIKTEVEKQVTGKLSASIEDLFRKVDNSSKSHKDFQETQGKLFQDLQSKITILESKVITVPTSMQAPLVSTSKPVSSAVATPSPTSTSVQVPSWLKSQDEAVYGKFLKGALIYSPTPGNDVGKIVLPISALGNPLEGTFDLSKCGDTGKYLSISTGYRKGKKAENANKVEIWFAPRFLIEKEVNTTAKHFQAIFPANWNANAPVGMFWTWGGWGDLTWYDYLTTDSMDNLSKIDLYENWKKSAATTRRTQHARPDFRA